MSWEDDDAIQAVQAGAKGPPLKNARSDEVVRAGRLVAAGSSEIDPPLAPVLLRGYPRMPARGASSPRAGGLNQRDPTRLRLLAAGYNYRRIAGELVLAGSPIKNYPSALFHSMGVRDRTQAVLHAIAEGLVPRPVAS